MEYYSEYFKRISECVISAVEDLSLFDDAEKLIENLRKSNNKIVMVGNGGSAAISSHVSVDFVKAAGVRAINFNEADLITCFANDYGYEHWVENALDAYADSGDLLILISSSGKSLNIINAADKARSLGMSIITFSGFSSDNPLRNLGDLNFWADSSQYNIVEMTHHIWLLALVDRLATLR
jgi:D-sedoheptulose 7-phosphate isomerase